MAKTNTGPRTGTTEDGLRWEETEYAGTTYRLREVTVEEMDTAFDAALNPDKTYNGRLQSRVALCSSIITPTTTIDDIGKWPNAKLIALLRAYDKLNVLPPASAEGEDSAPAT